MRQRGTTALQNRCGILLTTNGEVSTRVRAITDVWLTWNITDILLDESGDTHLIVRCKKDRRNDWARDKLTFVNAEGVSDVNIIEPEHSDYKPYIELTYKEPHVYEFDKYVYDNNETTDNPFYLTMDSDYEVYAYFNQQ